MSEVREHELTGYRSVDDTTFDLNGELSTEIGWVVVEVSNAQLECCRGIIGTINNYATLRLMRFARAQKACQIRGDFDNGKQMTTLMLADVVFNAFFVLDTNSFVSFSANVIKADSGLYT